MVYNSLKCVSFLISRAVLGQLYLWISTLTIATGRHCAHCYPENHALMWDDVLLTRMSSHLRFLCCYLPFKSTHYSVGFMQDKEIQWRRVPFSSLWCWSGSKRLGRAVQSFESSVEPQKNRLCFSVFNKGIIFFILGYKKFMFSMVQWQTMFDSLSGERLYISCTWLYASSGIVYGFCLQKLHQVE